MTESGDGVVGNPGGVESAVSIGGSVGVGSLPLGSVVFFVFESAVEVSSLTSVAPGVAINKLLLGERGVDTGLDLGG